VPPGPLPPHIATLIGWTRLDGKMLRVVTMVILALMIWQPRG
jgi:hypothetical protein